jgi:S-adenosylmethionine synthetase
MGPPPSPREFELDEEVFMGAFVVSTLQFFDDPVEIVERKGLGHPDTICDALAESLSRALCREYRTRFGAILHHNG